MRNYPFFVRETTRLTDAEEEEKSWFNFRML